MNGSQMAAGRNRVFSRSLCHLFSFSFVYQEPNLSLARKRKMEANRAGNHNRTIARSFSLELMDIFRIDNSITDLDEQVDKRSVSPDPRCKGRGFPAD